MITFAQRGGVNEGVKSVLKTIKLHLGLRALALAERMATSAKNVECWLKRMNTQQVSGGIMLTFTQIKVEQLKKSNDA